MRANGRSMLPMVIGFVAIATNTALNYILIFGNFSAPALGIEGAAYATVIAKTLECVLLVGTLYWTASPLRLSLKDFLDSFKRHDLQLFARQSLPLVVNELIWALGIFSFTVVYGRMGTQELAAITLLGPIESISIELFIGFTSACSIILGTRLGASQFSDAQREARVLAVVITGGALVYGVLLAVFGDSILSIYRGADAKVLSIAKDVFFVIAATLWLRLYNVVACVGILRCGGDVRFTLLVDLCVIWLLVLPLTAYCGLLAGIPVQWVYAVALGVEAVAKAPIYTLRIGTKVWLKNLVSRDQADPPEVGVLAATA
jgi:Na+-driven multidrug efflux pump